MLLLVKVLFCQPLNIMKKIIIVIGLLLILIIGLNFYSNQRIKIKLINCIDGDTAWFIINDKKEKVRFLGIDTPESTTYIEEYGKEASDYTCNVLKEAKHLYIEYDLNSDRYDKYNRVLGWIFVDNDNLSKLLLSKGYAEVNYIYGDYKYLDELCIEQEKAYFNKLGIWSRDYDKYQNNYCNKEK